MTNGRIEINAIILFIMFSPKFRLETKKKKNRRGNMWETIRRGKVIPLPYLIAVPRVRTTSMKSAFPYKLCAVSVAAYWER